LLAVTRTSSASMVVRGRPAKIDGGPQWSNGMLSAIASIFSMVTVAMVSCSVWARAAR
jgi:hypothetical protein